MDFHLNIALSIVCIILAIGIIIISIMLLRMVLRNNRYLMIEHNSDIYEQTIRKNKPHKLDPKIAKQLNDEREWINMQMGGVITEAQLKKFGETVDEI